VPEKDVKILLREAGEEKAGEEKAGEEKAGEELLIPAVTDCKPGPLRLGAGSG
jgi:hypothetical protein